MEGLFQLVNSRSAASQQDGVSWLRARGFFFFFFFFDRIEQNIQFLEVAIGNVVATPVRHSVKLDAVGELHLVLIFKPAALLSLLGCSPCCCFFLVVLDHVLTVIGELVLFLLLSSRCTPPSLRDTNRGRDFGSGRDALLTC